MPKSLGRTLAFLSRLRRMALGTGVELSAKRSFSAASMDFELVSAIREIQPIAIGRGLRSAPDYAGAMERAAGENSKGLPESG
jgi:hypothetical protein